MKAYYKKDQDWKIKDPQKLEVKISQECPEGYIENGLKIWKDGGYADKKTSDTPIKPKTAKVVRKTSKKKSQKR